MTTFAKKCRKPPITALLSDQPTFITVALSKLFSSIVTQETLLYSFLERSEDLRDTGCSPFIGEPQLVFNLIFYFMELIYYFMFLMVNSKH